MNKKLLLVPAFLLGSLCIYCTETVVTVAHQSSSDGGGVLDPVGTAHADPVTFSVVSEGTFTGQSDIITVEGSARISIAIAATPIAGKPQAADPECKANWVVSSGKLASATFENAVSSIYMPMNNKHSDVAGPMPVVLPNLQIVCNVLGPVDYVVYGIK